METALLLHPVEAERKNGHIIHSHVVERLAEHPDIVGRAAPAPGLELNERALVRVVFSAREGIELLPAHTDGGVTHIVMYMFQPALDHLPPARAQDLEVVPVHMEDLGDEPHMDREDVRRENGVGLFHLSCEGRILESPGACLPDGLFLFLFHVPCLRTFVRNA